MGKTINIGGRFHSTEVGNVVAGANEVLDDTKGKKQSVINGEVDVELLRLENEKQDNLSFDNTPTENSTNPVTSGGVYAADALLQQAIEAILALIPSAATALNQLADKAFVNSTVATNTATFRGTYNVVTDLGLAYNASHQDIATALLSHIATADNNDYAFVQIPVSGTSEDIRVTERYKFNGEAWAYGYDLNNSGFTAAQWAAINSGITALLVEKLGALPTAAELALALAGKQATLTFDNAPVSGSNNPVTSGGLYELFAAIDAKFPANASANNKLVAEDRLAAYVAAIIDALDASFDLTSADGHVTFRMTQTNGVITSVQILTSDIASASALTTLGGRVSTNETDIANLQAAYAGLTQSDVIVVNGALPSSGQQQNIIYRQPDPDHTPPQYYSDYMWNGSTWVLMATYNNGIDSVPTDGSNNLITSGAVAEIANKVNFKTLGTLNASESYDTWAFYDVLNNKGKCLVALDFVGKVLWSIRDTTANTWLFPQQFYTRPMLVDIPDGHSTRLYISNYTGTSIEIKLNIVDESGLLESMLPFLSKVSSSVMSETFDSFQVTNTADWQDNVFTISGKLLIGFLKSADEPINMGIYDATVHKWIINNHIWNGWEYAELPEGHRIRVYKYAPENQVVVSCKVLYGSDLLDFLYGSVIPMGNSILGKEVTHFESTSTNQNFEDESVSGKGYSFINFVEDSGKDVKIGIYDLTTRSWISYPQIWKSWEFVYFPSGHRILFNHNTVNGDTAVVHCKLVYGSNLLDALPSLEKKEITVGVGGDFQTLKEGIMYAYSKGNMTVRVLPGTYDILQEWAEEISARNGYGNLLGNGMHLIFMAGSYVTCLYELSGDTETDDWMETNFNPFYTNRTDFILEGLNIRSSNCRYSLHDECAGNPEPYVHKYINCHMENKADRPIQTAKYVQAIGGGLGQKGFIVVDGGYYDAVIQDGSTPIPSLSYHSNYNCDSRIFIKDAYIAGNSFIRFGAYGDGETESLAQVCGCSMGGSILNTQEVSGGHATSTFDLKEWNNIIRS